METPIRAKRIEFLIKKRNKVSKHVIETLSQGRWHPSVTYNSMYRLKMRNDGKNAFFGCSKKGCRLCKASGKSFKQKLQEQYMDEELVEYLSS